MKRLTLDVDNDTHRRLRIQAATVGLSMADLGRALIRDYLDADDLEKERLHRLAAAPTETAT